MMNSGRLGSPRHLLRANLQRLRFRPDVAKCWFHAHPAALLRKGRRGDARGEERRRLGHERGATISVS